ncbi:hypothetical protein V502_06159 [Pseudogymnoascus sp. VKM F-4520 (FW-2644)]|nr:hypothetical protein V502_06159 [Pseudogymnoascus sp. VKM F-4520 (FW-2644)]
MTFSNHHNLTGLSLPSATGTDPTRPSHLISSPSPSPSFCFYTDLHRSPAPRPSPVSAPSPHAAPTRPQLTAVLRLTPALCCRKPLSSSLEAMTVRASTAARQRCMSRILPTDQVHLFPPSRRLRRFRSRVHMARRSVAQSSHNDPTTVQPPLQNPAYLGRGLERRLLFWGGEEDFMQDSLRWEKEDNSLWGGEVG